jgi:acyl transferase domain-containing protein
MSIVGVSGLYLDPAASVIPLSNFNLLSLDCHCNSSDAQANGYTKGEEFGVLVLKRVVDALRDGNTIRAVIRGTSTNHDGQTSASPEIADTGRPSLAFPRKTLSRPKSGLEHASIDAFGYGSTNAHIILDDALHFLRERGLVGRHNTREFLPAPERSKTPADSYVLPYLLLWSASDEAAVGRQAEVFSQHTAKLPTYAPSTYPGLASG